MKLQNQFTFASPDKPRWEKTPDGFLRCRARVLAERILPYARHEMECVPDEVIGDHIMMLVTRDTMATAESIRSLEGAPVVIGDHTWLTPDTVKDFAKGSVAGTPTLDGPYLVCDLLVTHPDAIAYIEGGGTEISAAYLADTIFEPGEFDGQPFHAKQTQLRYNHIAIIPEGHGRCGQDVRIINKHTKGESIMPDKIVRVQLRNSKRFVNTDEEGAAALAEENQVAQDESTKSGKSLEECMAKCQQLQEQCDQCNAELEECKGELSVYKEKLDQLLSTEAVEHAAMEMVAEKAEAEEIIENAMCKHENEKDEDFEKRKTEVQNSIKTVRGAALHKTVLTAIGVKVENMSPEAARGAFKAQHQIGNATKGRTHVAGARMFNSTTPTHVDVTKPVQRTSRERLGLGKK